MVNDLKAQAEDLYHRLISPVYANRQDVAVERIIAAIDGARRAVAKALRGEEGHNMDINKLVEKFLAWPLPDSVCSDLCATKQGYPHRSGTTLLSAVEAKQMLEYLLVDLPPLRENGARKRPLARPHPGTGGRMTWITDRPTRPGWYWWRPHRGTAPECCHMFVDDERKLRVAYLGEDAYDLLSDSDYDGQWSGPIPEPGED